MGARFKLVTVLLLFSVTPILIIVLVERGRVQLAVTQQVGTSSLELARLSLSRISEYLYERVEDVRSWSRNLKLEDIDNPDGQAQISQWLDKNVKDSGDYLYAIVLDPSGKIVASSDPTLLGRRLAGDPGLREALDGKPSVGDVAFDALAETYAVVISFPIESPDGSKEILGVLSAALKWDRVNSAITEIEIEGRPQTMSDHLMLTNRDGLVISCYDPAKMFKTNLSEFGMKSSLNSREQKEGFLLEAAEHGLPSFSAYTYMKKYKDLPELGWCLVLLQDPKRVFAPVYLLTRTVFIGLAIFIAAVALVSFLFAGLIVRPIQTVAAAADIAARGDLSIRVPVTSKDEIGVLSVAFNNMIDKLASAEEELENLVAKLEAQNAELERFTYTVSHDLKSPLITLKGYMGALKQDLANGNDKAIEDDLTHMADAADKMAQLLEELLELSRIGRVANPPEDVALGELAAEAVELVEGRITQGGVKVEIAPDTPVLYGDRTRLREVLQNLIENAVKHMGDQPQPRVEIGGRQDGGETVCYVRDNGIGIDSNYQEKVFDLFEKIDSTSEGTGIGLALVKRIIEVHGGRIWVESEGVGQGSTFCFTLQQRTDSTEQFKDAK